MKARVKSATAKFLRFLNGNVVAVSHHSVGFCRKSGLSRERLAAGSETRVNEEGASGASVVHVSGGPVQGGGVEEVWSLTYVSMTSYHS